MKYIKTKIIKNTGLLIISNPGQLNALNSEVLNELDQTLKQFESNSSIKVLIITGDGEKAFVAGADIKAMESMSKSSALQFSQMGHNIFSKIENFKKPIIAAINGYALGGGSELALACHIRCGSEKARIGQPEVKLGIIAGWGGTQRLPQVVSKGKAIEILTSGKIYSANECYKMGLIDNLYKHDELIDKCIELAQIISKNGPNAIQKSIELINKSFKLNNNAGLHLESDEFSNLFNEDESSEGLKAFIEKRNPNFD